MKKRILYAIGVFSLVLGFSSFITFPEEAEFCLIEVGEMRNAGPLEGNLCYTHSQLDGPVIYCDDEECGQCQAKICLYYMWPCSQQPNPNAN